MPAIKKNIFVALMANHECVSPSNKYIQAISTEYYLNDLNFIGTPVSQM